MVKEYLKKDDKREGFDLIEDLTNYDDNIHYAFTLNSQTDKAISTLQGILYGIAADGLITEDEATELRNWYIDNKVFVNKEPFYEIMQAIERAAFEKSLTKDEMEDLLFICKNVTSKSLYYDAITRDIQTLHGIMHGILADNIITDEEILELNKWMQKHPKLKNEYPYAELKKLLKDILKDGVVSKDERDYLKLYFSKFIDIKNSTNLSEEEIEEIRKRITVDGVCAENPDIKIKDKYFCFTGKSVRMPRNDIMKLIKSKGGYFKDSVVNDLDYLVIGVDGSPCWAFSQYGRKIEAALERNKNKYVNITIVNENDFWKVIDNM